MRCSIPIALAANLAVAAALLKQFVTPKRCFSARANKSKTEDLCRNGELIGLRWARIAAALP